MKSIPLFIVLITTSLAAQFNGPVTVYQIEDRYFIREKEASSFAQHWLTAYNSLRVGNQTNQIEIVTVKDGVNLKISNVYKLERSVDYKFEGKTIFGNLLIASQRQGSRDYRTIIDPRQIVTIREAAK